MNTTAIKVVGGFVVGAGVGAYGMYRYIRAYFETKTEEDVEEVRKYYQEKFDRLSKKVEAMDDELLEEIEPEEKEPEKVKVNYANVRKSEAVKPVPTDEDVGPEPYLIDPDECGELDGYRVIFLTLYSDGVLTDANDIIVEDVEATVGDALDHFGDYAEDEVWCRNDRRKCDYDIVRSNETFEDIAERMPIPLNGG